jgi:hypothetical protein
MTIKHAAKKFLSTGTVHGRTRNKLRRGDKIVQKAGDAIIQGVKFSSRGKSTRGMNKIDTLGIWSRLELQLGCGSI